MNSKLLEERVHVLYSIISSTHDRYFNPEINDGQRGLYETLLGACIWYLPGSDILYSGKISEAALESLKNNPVNTKLVEEHSFPRKVGGKYLYELFKLKNAEFTESDLIELYKAKLGKFNLVLKSENDNLKKWQKFKNTGLSENAFIEKVSTIEEYAYSKAEIKLCDFPIEKYKEFKKFKSKLKSKNAKIDKSSLTFTL